MPSAYTVVVNTQLKCVYVIMPQYSEVILLQNNYWEAYMPFIISFLNLCYPKTFPSLPFYTQVPYAL